MFRGCTSSPPSASMACGVTVLTLGNILFIYSFIYFPPTKSISTITGGIYVQCNINIHSPRKQKIKIIYF
jgi:hypothetical protein